MRKILKRIFILVIPCLLMLLAFTYIYDSPVSADIGVSIVHAKENENKSKKQSSNTKKSQVSNQTKTFTSAKIDASKKAEDKTGKSSKELYNDLSRSQQKYVDYTKASNKESKFKEGAHKGVYEASKKLDSLYAIGKDAFNGGDFDTTQCINTILDTAATVAACFPGYGTLIAAAIKVIQFGINLFIGGSEETSELSQMEDRLNQQFDELQESLSDIEDEIKEISNKIDESTMKIIEANTTALDNQEAKNELKKFMLSGEGNFSYKQFKNVVAGELNNNSMSSTAYKAQLTNAKDNNYSDEMIKYYYDCLYYELVTNVDIYTDYLCGTDDGDSIIISYYKTLKATGEYSDIEASEMTIEFASELYDFLQTVDILIATCNMYQYEQILNAEMINNNTKIVINYNSKGEFESITVPNDLYYDCNGIRVTVGEIYGTELLPSMSDVMDTREAEVRTSIAEDLITLCYVDEEFIVEDSSNVYCFNMSSDANKVLANRTVYLIDMYGCEDICELFEIDVADYYYRINGTGYSNVITDMFNMRENAYVVATLYYLDNEIGTYEFSSLNNDSNLDGNGTEANPYRITSLDDFYRIENDLNASYILDIDLDGNNTTKNPIGYYYNNGVIKNRSFNGKLDGNGKTIKNITINSSYEYAGLFGALGEEGEISNLKLENVTINQTLTEAKKTYTYLYGGILVGVNDGEISNIEVKNSNITSSLDNKILDRNIFYSVGGISGKNNGLIHYCSVLGSIISGKSEHFFDGQQTINNKNNVYVGGISGTCSGMIDNCIVGGNGIGDQAIKTQIIASAKSVLNPKTTVNPYVYAYGGGIVGYLEVGEYIQYITNVYSGISKDNINVTAESDHDVSVSRVIPGKKNTNNPSDVYININKNNKVTDDDINKIKGEKNVISSNITNCLTRPSITYEFNTYSNNKWYGQAKAGSKNLDLTNFKIFVNGSESEYGVVGIYNFDTNNLSFKNTMNIEVSIVISLYYNFKEQYFVLKVPVTISENYIADAYIYDIYSIFYTGESVNFNTAKIAQYDAFGNCVDDSLPLSGCIYEATPISTTTVINEVKECTIKYLYEGKYVEIKHPYYVACRHNIDESTLNKIEVVKATCCSYGYTKYHCGLCGEDVYMNYTAKTGIHNYVLVGNVTPTCYNCGETGTYVCKDCGHEHEASKNERINMVEHNYKDYYDCTTAEKTQWLAQFKPTNSQEGDKYHKCVHENDDNAYEPHQYSVSSKVEEYYDNNGVKHYREIITYTCIVCGHTYSVENDNYEYISKDEPYLMVTNGYALFPGDFVTVYVQVKNLKDARVQGGAFNIRYNSNLELVGVEDGSLLSQSIINVNNKVLCGYNFVFADSDTFSPVKVSLNGNTYYAGDILKLKFRIPKNAHLNDEYEVGIGYGMNNDELGGLGIVENNSDPVTKQLDTYCGVIKLVSHLPGDVNNDGKLDLSDALLIADYFAGKPNVTINKTYADVNLDGKVNLDDIFVLLSTITEKNINSLLYQEFDLVLNYNGWKDEITSTVNLYDDNGNLNKYELDSLEREGYKFLGWYTGLADDADEVIDNSTIIYNKNQKVQTLYAHWELNQIEFSLYESYPQIGITGTMPKIYYTSNYEFDENQFINRYKREYNLEFIDRGTSSHESVYENRTLYGKLVYKFVGWNEIDSEGDPIIRCEVDSTGKIIVNGGENGPLNLSKPNLGKIILYAAFDYGTIIRPEFVDADTNVTTLNNDNKWKTFGYNVYWFSSETTLPNTEIDLKPSDLELLYDPSQETIKVYATFTPIKYTIVFNSRYTDVTNTLQNITNCSILTSTSLNKKYTKNGYTQLGWTLSKTSNSVTYNFNDTITYINSVKNNKLTLYAVWRENKYNINFSMNQGNTIGSEGLAYSGVSNITNKYYNNSITLPTASMDGYIFNGWTLGVANADILDSYHSNGNILLGQTYVPNDGYEVTLYASWTVDQSTIGYYVSNGTKCGGTHDGKTYMVYTDPMNTQSAFNGSNNAVFEYRDLPYNIYLMKNKLIVLEDLDNAYFYSDTRTTFDKVTIATKNYLKDETCTIYLSNMNITSGGIQNYYSINNDPGMKLVLNFVGTNNISAESYTSAIGYYKYITINGSGTTTINGWSGSNATSSSGNGDDGTPAIKVTNLTINSSGIININGGNGGNGKNGSSGVNGTSYGNGTAGNCPNGGNGGTGGKGGNGGKGAVGIMANYIFVYKGTINVKGGDSGNAGSGGTGGNGGSGANCVAMFNTAGNGGNGGPGGNGGSAYKGAKPISGTYTSSQFNSLNTGVNGVVGSAGTGGLAGTGGSSNGWLGSNDGSDGCSGTSGNSGTLLSND